MKIFLLGGITMKSSFKCDIFSIPRSEIETKKEFRTLLVIDSLVKMLFTSGKLDEAHHNY
jgi:hypothetical protein